MAAHKKRIVQLSLIVGVIAAAAWFIESASTRALTLHHATPRNVLAIAPNPSDASDGKRLAHVNGCFGCHGSQLTGRVIFTGWFGSRIVAPNLTRLVHHETDAQLAAAIRFGVKHDGTSIIEMPSNQFIKSSDSDIAAIIAYLHTLPQRPDAIGETRWRFGGRFLLAMGFFPVEAAIVDASARGPLHTPVSPLALGHYITQSQCSRCHGEDLSGKTWKGTPDLYFAIQHYSPMTFEKFFKTGQGQIGHGTRTMTRMIQSRFHYLTSADIEAIYSYLHSKSLPS